MLYVGGQTGHTQLTDDQWQVGAHEALCKNQFTKYVLVHEFNGHPKLVHWVTVLLEVGGGDEDRALGKMS